MNGGHTDNAIEIQADNCEISGLKVINSINDLQSGILVRSSSYISIVGNTFKDNFMGLYVTACNNCTIAENTIQYNIFGMYLVKPENCIVLNNTFTNSGLVLSGSPSVILSSIFQNNTVNGKPIYIYTSKENITISDSDAGQILIGNCHHITIENLTIQNTSIGIMIGSSSDITIRNNTLKNIHRGGISLHGDDCNVYNNSFINCSYGCYLEGGNNFNLHHNNFIKCFKHDERVFSYIKKHQTFMQSTNIKYDSNYWDDWIGLKRPFLRRCPKIIPGFRTYKHKQLNIFPIFRFDWHPALEPYE